MTRYYFIRRERARDWRVYETWVGSGAGGECVSMHTTKNGAAADARRRNRALTAGGIA